MKRILWLVIVIGISLATTAMAMGKSRVRKETRFLTDKMAYELNLNHRQYDDVYEINYDFMYAIRHILDEVVCGYEWALDDYYEALDIRNDDLRWVLSERQYRRFIAMEYFHRPIYVHRGHWHLRVYLHYPDRELFYFGVPHHYHSYCGAHYRPHFHQVSYYRGRHDGFHHCSNRHRVRERSDYHSVRRSDFGAVRFRPNTTVRSSRIPSDRHSQSVSSRRSQDVSHRHSSHYRSSRNTVSSERRDNTASCRERSSRRSSYRGSERD